MGDTLSSTIYNQVLLQSSPASRITARYMQEILGGEVAHVHVHLLEAYQGSPPTDVADIPDDGYIMQNAGHHLLHAQDLAQLKSLLMRSAWLESKLISYGVASVVADFRYTAAPQLPQYLRIHSIPVPCQSSNFAVMR